jgi:prevent-host-death family protein
MTRISVVKAKANFSRLLAEVEAGQEVVITRRGTAVAKISAVAAKKTPLNLKSIAEFRAGLASTTPAAADLVRRLRDERY